MAPQTEQIDLGSAGDESASFDPYSRMEGRRVDCLYASIGICPDLNGEEIIVVDDGSAHRTTEVASKFASKRGKSGIHREPRHRGDPQPRFASQPGRLHSEAGLG